ncbi:Tyrosine-protein phosphatase Lar-like [Schistosoma japonicum]|nr:Tyrosine-protein phosphatase Lar-like [Schistosoma japonicum]
MNSLFCIIKVNKCSIVKIHVNNSNNSLSYYCYYFYHVYQYWIIKFFILHFMIFCNITICGLSQPWFSLEALHSLYTIEGILLPIVDGIHNLENIKCINSHELNNENLQDQDILSILFAFKSHHTLYDNHGDDDDDGILNKVHQINNGNTLLQTTFNTKQSLKYNHLKCKQKVTIIKRLNKLFKRIKRTVLTNEHVPTAYEYVPFIKSKLYINIFQHVTIRYLT